MSNYITIKLRRGTAAQWSSTNPVLAEGEVGLETDTRKFKVGTGAAAWNSLNYWGGSGGGGATDFIDLDDVPASYFGQAGKYVKVNGTADGLEFATLTIAAGDLPTGIDAAKIADGTVSNTEFQYLDGVTSAIQTQLDGKVDENAAITGATKTKITYDAKGLVTAGADAAIADITGLQTALDGKVDENAAITGATKTKITYDAKGLVTAGADATTADIADSTDKRYVTDADLTKLSNTSGTNTGDQNLFSTIAVSGQSNVVADTTGDTLTLVAGSNVTITTDASTDSITISASGGGGGSTAWGDITGTLSNQTDLQTALDGKVDENAAITGATKTKITYDAKGLVTAGADATTADIADSTDKRYVTEAEKTKLSNLSGTNTGDQTITLTGDVTGSGTGSFAATIANGAVTNAKVGTGIDAAKLADGSVSNTEFQHLNGVTSAIQTQIDSKITAFADPNADRIVFWDDSAGAFAPLEVGSGLSISGTTLTATGGGGGSGDLTTLTQTTTQTGPVNTTTETAIFSYTLPTDLAAGETLVLDITGEVLNNSGAGQTVDIYIKLGTTTAVFYSTTQGNSSTKRSFHMRVLVFIVSTTSQKFSVVSQMAPGNTGTGGAITTSFAVGTFAGYGTAAENTTSAKTLQVTADLGAANASFYWYAEAATLTRIAAP